MLSLGTTVQTSIKYSVRTIYITTRTKRCKQIYSSNSYEELTDAIFVHANLMQHHHRFTRNKQATRRYSSINTWRNHKARSIRKEEQIHEQRKARKSWQENSNDNETMTQGSIQDIRNNKPYITYTSIGVFGWIILCSIIIPH